MPLHMMKLVVGLHSLQDFARYQQRDRMRHNGKKVDVVRTRYQPRQAQEIISSGGSIFRVIKGVIACRQKIIAFETYESPLGTKCRILCDTEIIRTRPVPKKAFQGWRYLKDENAPEDIAPYKVGDAIPSAEMEAELVELGLL